MNKHHNGQKNREKKMISYIVKEERKFEKLIFKNIKILQHIMNKLFVYKLK